jgi:4-hydroxy-tetrahydrodipicolinate synthase
VNALPDESVLCSTSPGRGVDRGAALYDWFLPLLRLDTLSKFVQLIKLVQVEMGKGTATVRPPRLELAGREYDDAIALIRNQLATRPALTRPAAPPARTIGGGGRRVRALGSCVL